MTSAPRRTSSRSAGSWGRFTDRNAGPTARSAVPGETYHRESFHPLLIAGPFGAVLDDVDTFALSTFRRVTASAAAHQTRPVVIVPDDRFDATASVTVCPLTTDPVQASLTRITVEPSVATRIEHRISIMVDKITTMPRTPYAIASALLRTLIWSGSTANSSCSRSGRMTRRAPDLNDVTASMVCSGDRTATLVCCPRSSLRLASTRWLAG